MNVKEIMGTLAKSELRDIAIGAGAQRPDNPKVLLGGGLYRCAERGRMLKCVLDPDACDSLEGLGRLYLAELGIVGFLS